MAQPTPKPIPAKNCSILFDAGWTEAHLQRERSPGAIVVDNQGRGRRDAERLDYLLCLPIRAALEKIARGGRRVLISMATGTGKTITAVHLLRKLADARQLGRRSSCATAKGLRDRPMVHSRASSAMTRRL